MKFLFCPMFMLIALIIAPISLLQMLFGCDGDETVSMQLLEWAFDD